MTTKSRWLFVAATALFLQAAAVLAQAPFALHSGDRVVFYGDSITDQRLYTVFTETYVVTRFPKMPVTFVHSGWGGDRVTGGGGGPIDLRLERDVIAYHPTVMTIMLGMNDGGYRPFDENLFRTYADGYRHIIDKMKAAVPGIRITVIQPSPFDDVTRKPNFPGGYNSVLVRYGEFVKQLARDDHLTVADLNSPMVAMLRAAYATDPALAQKIIPDRVHPGPGGHLIMAECLLKAWNAPSLVASVKLDAASKQLVDAASTRVTNLHFGPSITWTQTDDALPMPVDWNDPVTALAVRSSDFMEALDQEPLVVANLDVPRWTLKIDGETIGTFTREELAAGINLAQYATPMARQAAQVYALTVKHNNIHFLRWRSVQVPLQGEKDPHIHKALAELDAFEADIVKEQRAAALPRPRHFELIPAP
ncbi:MAG: SGNH/GDSL hydrolase family protein [Chthonomonadales bacterium]